jgi:hypothetical protein
MCALQSRVESFLLRQFVSWNDFFQVGLSFLIIEGGNR